MTTIALLGAGGKMGVRLATNLMDTRFTVSPVEPSEAGRDRLVAATGTAIRTGRSWLGIDAPSRM